MPDFSAPQSDPKDYALLREQGISHFHLQEYKKALACFIQAVGVLDKPVKDDMIRQLEKAKWYHFILPKAKVLYESGHLEDAFSLYQLLNDPDSVIQDRLIHIRAKALRPFKEKQAWGFRTGEGEVLISPQFSEVRDFHQGLAMMKKKKWAAINKKGELLTGFDFDRAYDFTRGRCVVNTGGLYNYITPEGGLLCRDWFELAIPFLEENSTCVKTQTGWGFIDHHGDFMIEPRYEDIKLFEDGIAPVKQDGKWGYINLKGESVIGFLYEDARQFDEEIAAVRYGNLWGYINIERENKIAFQYAEASGFREGLAAVKIGNEYGFINSSGELVIPPRFQWTSNFFCGLCLVKLKNDYHYINKKGVLLCAAPEFKEILG